MKSNALQFWVDAKETTVRPPRSERLEMYGNPAFVLVRPTRPQGEQMPTMSAKQAIRDELLHSLTEQKSAS